MRAFIRFGSIPSRLVDARKLLLQSLEASGLRWRIVSIRNAGKCGRWQTAGQTDAGLSKGGR